MQKITEEVYLSRATSAAQKNDPALILLCSWMGADLKHIAKFSAGYQALYPGADILLVRSFAKHWLWKPADLSPAIKILQSYTDRPMMLHVMSNGGGLTVTQLAKTLASTTAKSPALPVQAICADSMPGLVSYKVARRAFSIPFDRSSLLIRMSVLCGFSIFYACQYAYDLATRRQDPMTVMRKALVDPALFDPKARCFLYSKTDELINYVDVDQHIADCKRQSPKALITAELYESSPHISHLRTDPTRYWAAIKATWAAASE